MNKLSGYIPVRNAIRLDYCIMEAIESLLPICDEVIVCDSGSDDGTFEIVRDRLKFILHPKVWLAHWKWLYPVDCKKWLLEWINFTRSCCSHEMQIQLDADEVLHEDSYNEIRNAVSTGTSRWFRRLNHWGDTRYLAPSGYVCGDEVARLGPTDYFMPSDEPHPEGEPRIRVEATKHPSLKIHHYGFIRKREAFLEKSEVVQTAFFGNCDDRLRRCRETGENWQQACPFPPGVELQNFTGTHPKVAHRWLMDHGYTV